MERESIQHGDGRTDRPRDGDKPASAPTGIRGRRPGQQTELQRAAPGSRAEAEPARAGRHQHPAGDHQRSRERNGGREYSAGNTFRPGTARRNEERQKRQECCEIAPFCIREEGKRGKTLRGEKREGKRDYRELGKEKREKEGKREKESHG